MRAKQQEVWIGDPQLGRVRWTYEPGRVRALLTHQNYVASMSANRVVPARLPDLAFATTFARGDHATSLHVFRCVEWSSDSKRVSLWQAARGWRPTCLGPGAAGMVSAGKLDAIDAFWMTGFAIPGLIIFGTVEDIAGPYSADLTFKHPSFGRGAYADSWNLHAATLLIRQVSGRSLKLTD